MFLFYLLFLEGKGGRKRRRETLMWEKHQLVASCMCPDWNQIGNLSLCRRTPRQPSYTSQGFAHCFWDLFVIVHGYHLFIFAILYFIIGIYNNYSFSCWWKFRLFSKRILFAIINSLAVDILIPWLPVQIFQSVFRAYSWDLQLTRYWLAAPQTRSCINLHSHWQ